MHHSSCIHDKDFLKEKRESSSDAQPSVMGDKIQSTFLPFNITIHKNMEVNINNKYINIQYE